MNAVELRDKIAELKKQREIYKVKAEGGKISIVGVFGKLGSPYSVLYSPPLLLAVTLTGQLSLLMLIERCEAAGIQVVSGNTDGVVLRCPRAAEKTLTQIVAAWETQIGFKVENTRYRSIYNSSVNCYIAIREDGKVKRKGSIANPWAENDLRGQLMKNPQMTICADAVLALIQHGTPLEETIRACTDPRAFITVIKVTGGGRWRDYPLGRVVRYYWSFDNDPILYSSNGRRVAKTEGAKPMMELTEKLPDDLDHLKYFEEAKALAIDLGVMAEEDVLSDMKAAQ